MRIAKFKTSPDYFRSLYVRVPSRGFCLTPWTLRHNEQGFQWLPQQIILNTFYDGDREGWIHIEIFLVSEFHLGNDTARAIRLPFHLNDGELLCVHGPHDGENQRREQTVNIPPGNYALYYETGLLRPFDELQKEDAELDLDDDEALTNPTVWCQLSFVPQQEVQPAILRAEPGFSPPLPLLLDHEPTQ